MTKYTCDLLSTKDGVLIKPRPARPNFERI